jgi:hypothetical protein
MRPGRERVGRGGPQGLQRKRLADHALDQAIKPDGALALASRDSNASVSPQRENR